MYTIAVNATPMTSGASGPVGPDRAIVLKKMKVPTNSVRSRALIEVRLARHIHVGLKQLWPPPILFEDVPIQESENGLVPDHCISGFEDPVIVVWGIQVLGSNIV